MKIKRELYALIFQIVRSTRRFFGMPPIVIFYVDNLQHYLIVKPVVGRVKNFYTFTPNSKIISKIDGAKNKRKVYFCDAILFTTNYTREELSDYFFFLGIKDLPWFQLFHGITDGFDEYTYQDRLRSYQLLLCSGRYRFAQFLKKGFPKKMLKLVGYPKFDYISLAKSHAPRKKKRILIIPTWGSRSCLPFLSGEVLKELSSHFDTRISIHRHNNLHHWKDIITKADGISVINDLDFVEELQGADLVISDVSSAAFEFLHFNRPIILVDTPWNKFLEKSPTNKRNIEYRIRQKISFKIQASKIKTSLLPLVKKALSLPHKHDEARQKMAKFLMYSTLDGKSPSSRIEEAINEYFAH